MRPKINLQDCLVGALAGLGALVVNDALHRIIFPYFSWGSNMCKICNCYECSSYNYFCDDCAEDVYEEFYNEDEAKTNLSMYN